MNSNQRENISKLTMVNVPPGTMREDIENLILQWKPNSKILVVDLGVPFYKCYRKIVFAFVYFQSPEDCQSVIQYYNENFKEHNGFLYRNRFGIESRIVVRLSKEKRQRVQQIKNELEISLQAGLLADYKALPVSTIIQLNQLVEDRKKVFEEKEHLKQEIDRLKLKLKFRARF